MATFELDPVFVRALKLLHSKSKDSASQLKQLVDDVIAQKKDQQFSSHDSEKVPGVKSGKPENASLIRKREAEKKSLEKLKQDLTELGQELKKPRLDSLKAEKEEKEIKEREKEKERMKKEKELKEKEEKEKKERAAAEKAAEKRKEQELSDSSVDTDEFALNMDIACVVCRQFDISSSNQLVECQECHNLYHQDCHKPPVIEQDVNDPRFVWYCSRCAKSLKKMASKPQKSIKPVLPSVETKTVNNGNKTNKSETEMALPFRRMEPKVSSSKDSSTNMAAKPLSGLASLAANLAGKVTADQSKSSFSKPDQSKQSCSASPKEPSKKSAEPSEKTASFAPQAKTSSKSAASSSKTSSAALSSVASADKRLQMMKKKAAAKLQEKRSFLK